MVSFLRRVFAPPHFENESDRHTGYLLHVILLGLILVPVPYVGYVVLFAPESAARALTQGAVGEALNISLLFLLHRGYVRTAAYLQVIAFWLFFTFSAITGDGAQGESYLLGYPLVIVIAGILLGGRMALGTTILSLLAGLFMVYAEAQGFIGTEIYRSAIFSWVTSLAIFPMGAILQYLSSRTVKTALERARLSEEKYKLISEVSSDYTFESVVDDQGTAKVFWVAGAFEKMTGYKLEEYLEAGGWFAHIHPDDLEKDAEDMQKLGRNEDVVNSEIRTIAKNGEIRWERIFAHPIWNEKENRLAGIIGAVQDITEQKHFDILLKETLLRQNAILNNIPDMAWLKDLDSRYIAVNEQFSKMCGFKLEEIIGKKDDDIWQKEFADHYRQDDLEVIQSGTRKEIEEILQDHNGRQIWIETTKTPIRNSQGDVTGTIGIARDITERKTAELERERLITELEAKNAELERFTYTVSHDLKAPLVTITGFLSYLDKDAREGKFDKFQRDLERIQQAAEKMRNLLNDLLELSRIGRIINEPVEIPFREIVREALAAVEGQLKARGVNVEYEDEAVMIYGDRIRLTEVLQNLLDNAVKFMGNQPEPRIRIGSIMDENNRPSFYVRDNGIGMDLQFSERIFGLFNKLDPNTQGSGVGLSVVKRIIEVHNGNIWVESQPGKGSTFYFNVKERD
jgi:PAS domain S-box-containing protein